jgi:hypothetical protein
VSGKFILKKDNKVKSKKGCNICGKMKTSANNKMMGMIVLLHYSLLTAP